MIDAWSKHQNPADPRQYNIGKTIKSRKRTETKLKHQNLDPRQYKILGNNQNEEKVWQQDTMLQNPDPIKYNTKTKSQYHEIAPDKLEKGDRTTLTFKLCKMKTNITESCVYTGFEVLVIYYFPLH